MKLKQVSLRGYIFRLVLVVAAYCVLFEIMARTDLIEKVMASTFNLGELAIIVLFLAARLFVYLVLIPLVISWGIYRLVAMLFRSRLAGDSRSGQE